MKSLSQLSPGRFRNLLFASLFIAGIAANAQSDYYSKTDSSKAYWKIQTDASSQKTLIRFFNSHHEPIYQETLSGRYVKLTTRNIRLFDQMLVRLLTNQLLSAEVKSHELVATSTGVPYHVVSTPLSSPVSTSFVMASPKESFENTPLRSDVAISNTGKLKILVMNLLEKPTLITLMDEMGRYVYKEKATKLSHNRTLNLTQLAAGKFRLEVSGAQKNYMYRVIIQENPRTYEIRAMR